jgi:hypothetical protein
LLRILAVAAEPIELRGVLRHGRGVRKEPWPAVFARSAEVRGNRWLMVAEGPGPKLARKAIEAVGGETWDAVLSTGLCGALDPSLVLYEVIAAERVNSFPAMLPQTGRPFRRATLYSSDRFGGRTEEKRRLLATGAQAADMEAAAVAEFAAARELPFFCVRVVSDTAGDEARIDYNAMRDDEGRFDRARLAVEACRHPFSAAPELIGWLRRAYIASGRLGDFLADCRF